MMKETYDSNNSDASLSYGNDLIGLDWLDDDDSDFGLATRTNSSGQRIYDISADI